MTLQDLWDKMTAAASPRDQVIAGVYASFVAGLSDDLGDLYDPQEFPKWVGDRVVHSAEEESALTNPPVETPVPAYAATPAAPETPADAPAPVADPAPEAPAAQPEAPAAEGGAQ